MPNDTLIEEYVEKAKLKFKCIQSDCDGNGNIPVQVGDGEWEAEQCQFHAEYLFPFSEILRTSLKEYGDKREAIGREVGVFGQKNGLVKEEDAL